MEIAKGEINEDVAPEQPPPIITDEFPTPNNPPWNGWVAIAMWAASVLFIIIFPSLFLLPYLSSQNVQITDNEQLLEFLKADRTAILLNVLAVIPAHLFTLLLAWLIVTKANKFSFRKTLGWTSGGLAWWHYCIILGVFFAFAAVVGVFSPEQENDFMRILQSSSAAVYAVAFLATFTAPLVEEVVYRGILYSAFQRAFGVRFAIVTVTFLFAFVHVPQYWPSYTTIFLLTILSLIFTLVRVRTNNLLPCIILHMIFNGLQSIFLVVVTITEDLGKDEGQVTSMILLLK